jgi:adenylate cyclase
MVADMIGYSQRLALSPIATHVAFKAHLRDVFTPVVQEHFGRVIKTTGDGFVAIFQNAGHAEGCGRAIQRRLTQQADQEPSAPSIKYRIAVHYGSIVIEQHDIFGIDVNIAIHMQQLAPAGGVCVSGALFSRLSEQDRGLYRYQGRKCLKNIPEPVAIHIFEQTPSLDRAIENRLPILRRRYLNPPPRLGVVEFETAADANAKRVFSNIAHECLMRALSRFGDIFAVAPIGATIAEIAPSKAQSRDVLANEMGCEYLLQGSCTVGSGTLHLMVQLESLVKRELLWSGKLSVDLDHQLDLIEELVVAEIVAPTVLYLERGEADPWDGGRHSEDEIRFRQARQLMKRRTLASLRQARDMLFDIVARCGEVGEVYVALARAEHSQGLLLAGDQFTEAVENAWGHAKKAVELDDLNPQAHAELALQEMFLKRHGDASEIYQRALRLNPFDSMLRADWADCLVNIGQPAEAASILEEILSGWPRDRAWVEWGLCDAYWALDRPDRIITLLDRHTDQPHVHRNLTACYAKLGLLPQARRHADKVRGHQPGFSAKAWRQVLPNTNADKSDEFVDYLERAGL